MFATEPHRPGPPAVPGAAAPAQGAPNGAPMTPAPAQGAPQAPGLPPQFQRFVDPNNPLQKVLLARLGAMSPQDAQALATGVSPQAMELLKKLLPEVGFVFDALIQRGSAQGGAPGAPAGQAAGQAPGGGQGAPGGANGAMPQEEEEEQPGGPGASGAPARTRLASM
jgi:hypothetical protein